MQTSPIALIGIVLASVLANPTYSKTEPATEAEVDSADEAHLGCLYDAVGSLDDGVSDAATIAAAVAPACSATMARIFDVRGRALSKRARYFFAELLRGRQIDYATTMVLRFRKEKADQGVQGR